MIDPALLREDPEGLAANFARRGKPVELADLVKLEAKVRALRHQEEALRARRNAISQEIGKLMQAGDAQEAEKVKQSVGDLGEQMHKLHDQVAVESSNLRSRLLMLPNLLHEDVPSGKDDDENRVARIVGEPTKFDFEPRDHVDLGTLHGILEFEQAAKMSGARFCVLSDSGALLQRSLATFMLNLHVTEHGYSERYVPFMVNTEAMTNTGQLPKFGSEDNFYTSKTDDLHLIPTAEVSLGNLAAGQTYRPKDLPLKVCAHSPCFRREAGSYGRDTRGMLRMHQFEKVELLQVTMPEHSEKAQEEILANAERVLQLLELPYRVVELCTGATGNAAFRTFDVEVWMPSQNVYREISSISNDTDFQARRMQARFRDGKRNSGFVHLLNGSGLAVGRTWIAVVENFQDADGSISIPHVLHPYMNGINRLDASSK